MLGVEAWGEPRVLGFPSPYSGFTVIQLREMQASMAAAGVSPQAAASPRNSLAAYAVFCPRFERRCLT